MISFKYGLTLLRDYSIDRVFFLSSLLSYSFLPFSVPKVTYTNQFIKTFFFLKKVPNIFNYFVFDCFIFFFQSKKVSYIFNCVVIDFFFSLKRFLTSLIMLSCLFLSIIKHVFFNYSSLYLVKKSFIFKIKINCNYLNV